MNKQLAQRREEGLAYLKEVINANRAMKDWMLRNTHFAILTQIGIFALFSKDSAGCTMRMMAVVLLMIVCGLAVFVLRSNRNSVERLREKERSIIRETPLPWVEKHWAGGTLSSEPTNQFYRLYLFFVVGTGVILAACLLIG